MNFQDFILLLIRLYEVLICKASLSAMLSPLFFQGLHLQPTAAVFWRRWAGWRGFEPGIIFLSWFWLPTHPVSYAQVCEFSTSTMLPHELILVVADQALMNKIFTPLRRQPYYTKKHLDSYRLHCAANRSWVKLQER